MKTSSINYGKIIKELRKKNSMTQLQLAEKLSIGKTAVSNYEIGYSIPPTHILENIAEIFEMSLIELISYDKTLIDQNTIDQPPPRYGQPVKTMAVPYIKPANLSLSTFMTVQYMNSYILLPTEMLTESAEVYVSTKVTDNSMESDGIRKNDYVIIKKSHEIADNQIVIAFDTKKDTYYIRRYLRENHIITLVPSSYSPEYQIIRADAREDRIKVVGYVEKALISFFNP